jgi:hypothetical protein
MCSSLRRGSRNYIGACQLIQFLSMLIPSHAKQSNSLTRPINSLLSSSCHRRKSSWLVFWRHPFRTSGGTLTNLAEVFHGLTNSLQNTLWPYSTSELYRPSDRCMSAKLVSAFADRGCHVVSATNPHGWTLCFLDQVTSIFFQAAQLYSRGWVDVVPDTLHLRKSGNARNRIRTSGSVARNSDHWTTEVVLPRKCRDIILFRPRTLLSTYFAFDYAL